MPTTVPSVTYKLTTLDITSLASTCRCETAYLYA